MEFSTASQVDLLEDLLKQYGPTGQEKGAVECLAAHMDGLGFHAEIDAVGNVSGSLGQGPNELMLLGHIDTVPGQIPVRREGEELWGRGAVDAKGPLACFTAAAALAGAAPCWKITVTGAVGEEGDARGARFLKSRPAPTAVVIGEPSGWDRLTLGYKGSAWFDYTYRRAIVHGAAREENACQCAIAFWNRVASACDAFNAGKGKVFEQLIPSVREMHSDSDGFYETAFFKLNFRLPPDVGLEELRSLLTEAALGSEITSYQLYDSDLAYRGDKNSPLVRAFLPAIRKQGGKPTFILKSGTSDMNVVGPVWQCPILAYGPGDSNLDHTPQEHILIPEYLRGIQVVKEAIQGITHQ
jgi:LysW-gamma-L-lysine carboxypeptidase